MSLTGTERSRNKRITAVLLGSRWAAVMLADYEDMDWNPDVVRTGKGRYASKEEAESEGIAWAQETGIPWKP